MGYLPFRKCGLLLLQCRLKPTKAWKAQAQSSSQMWVSSGAEKRSQPLLVNMSGENLTITHASFTALPFLFKYYCFSSLTDTLKQMNSEFFMLLQFPWLFLHPSVSPNMYIWRDFYHWRIYLKKKKQNSPSCFIISCAPLDKSNTILPFIFHLLQLLYCTSVTCISHYFKLQVFAACIP